ncbi:MAG: RNA polymerase factor sigma-54 [Firmicutes bacterium]|nr:RNA polymerase factor sigma-54 [Bacillota bacterium]
MSLKLGYDLTIEQTQKLVMTPELIQAIKILQFNTQELDAYVQEELLANPVLDREMPEEEPVPRAREEAEPLDWKEHIRNSAYDDISYRQWAEKKEPETDLYERYVADSDTLPEHLLFQLQFMAPCDEVHRIGKYIIESLDENGYMTLTVPEIAEAVQAKEYRVKQAVEIIQKMDPSGVGASDLQECLLIQLRSVGLLTEPLETIVREHLSDLADNRLGVIAKAMGITPEEVQQMGDVIRTLEPKPGRQFAGGGETKYIIPDVIVERTEDGYAIEIDSTSAPRLKVSSYYRGLLRQADQDKQLSEYLSDRVNSALWLIRSIDQRKQTIYNVAEAIVDFQRDFFDRGSKYMKTLTLRDVAERIGVHESTVSRSINGKYLQCCQGIFELKHFFSAGVTGGQGEGVSSRSIKEYIREIVDSEDPKKPCSDQAMVGMLAEKGFTISRRTVAKYRDELGILSSSKRRRY